MRPSNYQRIHDALCRLSLMGTLIGANADTLVLEPNDLYGFSQIIEEVVHQIRESIDLEGEEKE